MEKELKLDLEEFTRGAGNWLEIFDKPFALDAIPLHARPLKSAILMV